MEIGGSSKYKGKIFLYLFFDITFFKVLLPTLTPGDSGEQRNLGCCSLWGHKESERTQLNNSMHTAYQIIGASHAALALGTCSFCSAYLPLFILIVCF